MTAQTSPLLAALDAIEETARRATPGPWFANPGGYVELDDFLEGEHYNMIADTGNAGQGADAAHIALHDPAFTLRLVEGLREVMALHRRVEALGWHCAECGNLTAPFPCPTLAALTRALAGEEER